MNFDDFEVAARSKALPPNPHRFTALQAYELWRRLPKGVHSKALLFLAGMCSVPIRTRRVLPDEPSPEVLEAMVQAGARRDWAPDIYRAIRETTCNT